MEFHEQQIYNNHGVILPVEYDKSRADHHVTSNITIQIAWRVGFPVIVTDNPARWRHGGLIAIVCVCR